jgi:hypothetical protein
METGENSTQPTPKQGLKSLLRKSRSFRKVEESLKRRKKVTEFAELNEAVWQDAYKRKLIILGKEDKDGIDWSHFDFMIAHPGAWDNAAFKKPMEILRTYWKMFYPYLKKLTDEYEDSVTNHNLMVAEVDQMMVKYVDMIEEFKFMEAFIEDDKDRKTVYEGFREKLKAKIDAETEALKKEQAKREAAAGEQLQNKGEAQA